MKKAITILLAATLMLSMAACGGGNDSNNKPISGENDTPTTQEDVKNASNTTSDIQELTIGETKAIGDFEFTLTRFEFAEAVTNSSFKTGEGATDENYLLPTDVRTDDNIHVASDKTILLSYSYNLEYTGKEEIDFDVFLLPKVFYNDFVFATTGIEDSISFTGSECSISVESGKWDAGSSGARGTNRLLNSFNNSNFEIRAYVRVPRELMDNTDIPLSVSFELEGNELLYIVR